MIRVGKINTVGKTSGSRRPLPPWVKVVITLTLLTHALAVWVGAWAAGPSSDLERGAAGLFRTYYGLVDQGYSYRYFAPDPPPTTPVVRAVVNYRDGRTEIVRLPDRMTRPRMLYQRELALANHLASEVEAVRGETGDPGKSLWAQSYARHLGKTHPGARSVTLSIEQHTIPDPALVRREIAETGRAPDLDDPDRFYTVPERIGEFPCDAS